MSVRTCLLAVHLPPNAVLRCSPAFFRRSQTLTCAATSPQTPKPQACPAGLAPNNLPELYAQRLRSTVCNAHVLCFMKV